MMQSNWSQEDLNRFQMQTTYIFPHSTVMVKRRGLPPGYGLWWRIMHCT